MKKIIAINASSRTTWNMKLWIRILIFMLTLSVAFISGGCTYFSKDVSTVKDEDELTVILHAGGGYGELTYLNAQETFEYYYNMGYRYFEYDLRLSSDGGIIATHAWEHIAVAVSNDITYEEIRRNSQNILAFFCKQVYNILITEQTGACIQAERKVRPSTENLIWIMPT